MSNRYNINQFITLLIINEVPKFRDPYLLIRVLEWKFEMIENLATIEILIKSALIMLISDNVSRHYEITQEGKTYLLQHWDIGILEIKKQYPNEVDFIEALIS